MTSLLNPDQRNVLSIRLRNLEKSLREAGTWLQGAESRGILYAGRLELASEHREAALSKIAEALEKVERLAQELDLRPIEEDLTTRITASLALNRSSLIDARSPSLERYGELDANLAEILDSYLMQLIVLTQAIASLVRGVLVE